MQPESAAHLWDAATAAGLVREFVSGKSQEQCTHDLLSATLAMGHGALTSCALCILTL